MQCIHTSHHTTHLMCNAYTPHTTHTSHHTMHTHLTPHTPHTTHLTPHNAYTPHTTHTSHHTHLTPHTSHHTMHTHLTPHTPHTTQCIHTSSNPLNTCTCLMPSNCSYRLSKCTPYPMLRIVVCLAHNGGRRQPQPGM